METQGDQFCQIVDLTGGESSSDKITGSLKLLNNGYLAYWGSDYFSCQIDIYRL